MYDAPATGMLQQEYDDLISLVHPDSQNRMNALEYVHDVVGQNERKAVLPEEDITPPQSIDSPDPAISVSDNGVPESYASQDQGPHPASPTVVGSTGGSPPHNQSRDGDSQESQHLFFGSPAFSFSDSIQCAQLP